jgi:hypothetical protein
MDSLKKLLDNSTLRGKLLKLLAAFLAALAGQVVALGDAHLTAKLVLAALLAAAELAWSQVFPTIQLDGLKELSAPASQPESKSDTPAPTTPA